MVIKNGVVKFITEEDIADGVLEFPPEAKSVFAEVGVTVTKGNEVKIIKGENVKELALFSSTLRYILTMWFPYVSEIYLPKLEKVNAREFSNLSELKKVDLSSVLYLDDLAFSNDKSLTEISLPKVISIDKSCFFRTGLEKVELSASISKIGACAFQNTSLISFDAHNARIGVKAFLNSGLKHLKVNCLSNIGQSALDKCYSLETITVAGKIKGTDKTRYPMIFPGTHYTVSDLREDGRKVVCPNSTYAYEYVQAIESPDKTIYICKNGGYIVEKRDPTGKVESIISSYLKDMTEVNTFLG